MKKLRVASLFAGIGGIDKGFEKAGFQPVWANEIDPYCGITFNANFPKTKLIVDDICNIKGSDIPEIDVLTGGFPCQPFSIAGHRKGFEDDRGNMFFQITRIIEEMTLLDRQPQVILLENVKNLQSHNGGNTYKVIYDKLTDLGYFVDSQILNSSKHGGIPQNRERIFIIGFLDKNMFKKFIWPLEIKKKKSINSIINRNAIVDSKYYYSENHKPYPLLKDNVLKKDTVYQYRRVYVRENKDKVCPTLTANMGTGGHNVPIILDNYNHIRKLTPRECLLLQGFDKKFIIPEELSDARVYKQAGNAVTVNVITRLAKEIKRVMEDKIK